MKKATWTIAITISFLLSACAVTPQQQAQRQARQIKAQQDLSVALAKQCDVETAEMMAQLYNPPIAQTEKEKAEFTQRYQKKVNDPLFQACHKLAWENYKHQEELEQIQRYYDFGRTRFHPWHYCYACW
ncbi:hypothetical protein [Actinobacillus pleuropneumoniae]|uniref:Lipoprotein n=3 Tax=Actinobacillus pleuropneumoniae TaxID=715 RepID=A0A380VW38_ACTPL|nr:hypothetical protein [Actinobacillus pleuropneumoniae]ABY68964.1 hypothetical protein APJL_0373 [Actinobacillus pleuropneumoniae serovar 3 str. JL03]EFL78760.1 hypothetical protein APP2_1577 [Actinobacillus pleuropneumoniae serovar 2 str. 4226]EFL81437.1 hypothetical protein APP6_1125 [Actinobacillus pleuropneumoniae serovar 6 str. Femo]EFM88350.1 hypothetical protein appser2_3480 [Actinobacillus pleuropneumoniae serovar 2 str. S1536]EFM92608.1 hypothetical protein appser6_4240 [Actinobacil